MLISANLVKGLIKDVYDWAFEKYDAISEVWLEYYEEKQIDGDFWQRTSVVNSGSWRKTGQTEGVQAENINKGGITTGDWIFNGTPESGAVSDASGDGAYDGTAASPKPFFNLSNNTRS